MGRHEAVYCRAEQNAGRMSPPDGVVRLHDQYAHECAREPDHLKKINRCPQHTALSIMQLGKLRLMINSDGVVVDNVL
jgi:hypothetical protein